MTPTPLRLVALVAPRWSGASALAAELSAHAAHGSLPPGVIVPTDGAWFGRFRDGVTVHPELVELSGASRDDERSSGAVVHRDGVIETMRARPPQARQVVRDRLRRVIEDARGTAAHTMLLIAPGAVWQADPAELRRELTGLADTVDIGLLVRAPERALATSLAHAVRLADVTGATALTARAALSSPAASELAFGAALARWGDGAERAPLLVPSDRGADAIWGAFGIVPQVVEQRPRASADDAPADDAVSTVLPPLSRADLEKIANLARRRALTRAGRANAAAELAALRAAADKRALAGALGTAPHAPFTFTDDEVRAIRRRFRRELTALEAFAGVPRG